MSLNRVKPDSNMYPWCTHTWNPIRGRCPHQCNYCYMRSFNVGPLRFDIDSWGDQLGEDRTIFVGSSTDMFCNAVPRELIQLVIEKCTRFQENVYLFQTKNPTRFEVNGIRSLFYDFERTVFLGTTLETNRNEILSKITKAPLFDTRVEGMVHWGAFSKMISLEPIMDFDIIEMVEAIRRINPRFVSIGADSKRYCLPEPPYEKVLDLIEKLSQFTEVKIKDNLSRLKGGSQ